MNLLAKRSCGFTGKSVHRSDGWRPSTADVLPQQSRPVATAVLCPRPRPRRTRPRRLCHSSSASPSCAWCPLSRLRWCCPSGSSSGARDVALSRAMRPPLARRRHSRPKRGSSSTSAAMTSDAARSYQLSQRCDGPCARRRRGLRISCCHHPSCRARRRTCRHRPSRHLRRRRHRRHQSRLLPPTCRRRLWNLSRTRSR